MIKRKLFHQIAAHLREPEITLLIGPRQCGKTTLLSELKGLLEKQGEKTLFFNLDIEADKVFFTSQNNLLQKIALEVGRERSYVFIDEIQRKENAGIFLKGIYDMKLPYKFIVTGSGSVELKEQIHESLAGRKRLFELSTLTFEEFVNYKTDYRYETKLGDFFSVENETTQSLLQEYLRFGGYPKVVLRETLHEKLLEIKEIFQSYLEKDIIAWLHIEKSEVFYELLRLISAQVGNLTNHAELSRSLGLALPTLKNYLWYLQKTFILEKVTPFSGNLRTEILKSPVYYFHDLGLLQYAAGTFGTTLSEEQYSFPFENLVLQILKEKFQLLSPTIHFWRTKDDAEVDFVIKLGKRSIPFEVKNRAFKAPKVTRSLRAFISAYQPETAYLVNLSFDSKIQIDQTELIFLPFSHLYALDWTL